jgi:hypothetical protein
MTGLQNGAVYLIIIAFLGLFGKLMYDKWQENDIIRKHDISKLKKDLEKEE